MNEEQIEEDQINEQGTPQDTPDEIQGEILAIVRVTTTGRSCKTALRTLRVATASSAADRSGSRIVDDAWRTLRRGIP